MTSGYRDEADGVYNINVTPLVDVVLVLLVVFMVTAPAIAQRGIELEQAETATGKRVEGDLLLTIDAEQNLYLSGNRVDLSEARQQIEATVEANPAVKALIKADRTVPHGRVMEIVDLVKQAGIKRFAFSSRPKAGASPAP